MVLNEIRKNIIDWLNIVGEVRNEIASVCSYIECYDAYYRKIDFIANKKINITDEFMESKGK